MTNIGPGHSMVVKMHKIAQITMSHIGLLLYFFQYHAGY